MPPSRRALLSLVGASVAAGCSGRLDGSAATASPTETPTGTPDRRATLSFDATVERQPSPTAPAEVRVALRTTSGPFEVRFGPALLFSDGTGPPSRDVWILPETDVGPNDPPDEATDGCWRYTAERYVESSPPEGRPLAPDAPLTERYRLYTLGTDGPCLPDGRYRFDGPLELPNERVTLGLTLSLSGGRVEASGRVR